MTDQLAWDWLRRHERAFNIGAVDDMVRDYRPDATLEIHLDGAVVTVTGLAGITEALASSTKAGCQTTVTRVVADTDTIAAQIVDDRGRTVMVSFWELQDDRIARDVSIVVDPTALGLSAPVKSGRSVPGAGFEPARRRSGRGV